MPAEPGSFTDISTSHSLRFRAMILGQTIVYGSYSTLVQLCESNGQILFSSTTMNFILELTKLLLSLIMHAFTKTTIDFHFRHSLPYAFLGFLYFINNNLAVHIQLYMDPASYQILSNFKIATTAILYRIVIKRKLTRRQWAAVSLLFVAGLFYSLVTTSNADPATRMFIRPLGLPLIFVYCTLSGLSGVYNEWILKKHFEESLHVQNIYLYMYGSLFNFLPALFIPTFRTRSVEQLDLFAGFSIYTWVIIGTQAFNGLSMSVVMKHASNITRLFIISFSLVVTTVLSVLIFHLTLNCYFLISFAALFYALWLYHFD